MLGNFFELGDPHSQCVNIFLLFSKRPTYEPQKYDQHHNCQMTLKPLHLILHLNPVTFLTNDSADDQARFTAANLPVVLTLIRIV